eukprot:UN27308
MRNDLIVKNMSNKSSSFDMKWKIQTNLALENEHDTLRFPTAKARIRIVIGYSNGCVALYNYRLEEVFGKTDLYSAQIVNEIKKKVFKKNVKKSESNNYSDDEKVSENCREQNKTKYK